MMQPESRNAVVLVIDGLSAGMLGPYGNTWIETENFNRLAARSLVFDHAFTPAVQNQDTYNSLWGLSDSVSDSDSDSDERPGSLLEAIGKSGVYSTLMLEEAKLESQADSFDRIIPVQTLPSSGLANSMEETGLANFFAQALQAVSQIGQESGNLYWLHSTGLLGAWDAPYDLRTQLAHPDDPEPPHFHRSPACKFDLESGEPDELLGYQQAAFSQVFLIDQFLGVLLDLMETEAWRSTLFCLTSSRGFPLGAHGSVGYPKLGTASLNYEAVQVPYMICPPSDFAKPQHSIRNGSLASTKSLPKLLEKWFEPNPDVFSQGWSELAFAIPNAEQEAIVVVDGDFKMIQTHAWKLISGPGKVELFAKPDDRWEVNEVSRRCPHIVDSLVKILNDFQKDGCWSGPGNFELPEVLSTRA